MSVTASITNVSRGSLHDGPGVRTVVYLKGCGLRCMWCHNPETLSKQPHVVQNAQKCIHCGRCIELCENRSVGEDGQLVYDKDNCRFCGKCADICPANAVKIVGEETTADELFEQIKKDAHYYSTSGGGVTFSGGECLLWPDFVTEVAKKCKAEGIGTAVESALFVPWKNVEAVLPYIDLFFADLKIADSQKHKKYTGQDNVLILENLHKLTRSGKPCIIRIPVIPGVNDSDKDIVGFAEILKSLGDGISYVELLKYNNLAESKYLQIGAEYTSFADDPQTDEQMERLAAAISSKSGRKCIF